MTGTHLNQDKLTGLVEQAQAEFTEYFVRNYPGPSTIIGDPYWHAPKVFRAAQHAFSPMFQRIKELEGELAFIWKWVERAGFDTTLSRAECIDMLLHFPGAPWNEGEWDVSHKPYAERFYAKFPEARATLTQTKDLSRKADSRD